MVQSVILHEALLYLDPSPSVCVCVSAVFGGMALGVIDLSDTPLLC